MNIHFSCIVRVQLVQDGLWLIPPGMLMCMESPAASNVSHLPPEIDHWFSMAGHWREVSPAVPSPLAVPACRTEGPEAPDTLPNKLKQNFRWQGPWICILSLASHMHPGLRTVGSEHEIDLGFGPASLVKSSNFSDHQLPLL